jgi:hypothetical protein
MEAVIETTGGQFPAHTYLLDGNNLVAYVKKGETVPFYFKNPIKGFDKRGRKFAPGNKNLFTTKKESNARTVRVQDLPIEVPVNTWQNMCDYLKGLA